MDITFPKWLAELLESRGWSHEKFGEMVGKSHGAVGAWVRGKYLPKPDILRRIAEVAGMEFAALANTADTARADPGAVELAANDAALSALDAKRTRYEELAGDGLLPRDRLAARLSDCDAEESKLRQARSKLLDAAGRQIRRGRVLSRAEAFLSRYDELALGPPGEFHAFLSEFVDRIVVSRNGITALILAS